VGKAGTDFAVARYLNVNDAPVITAISDRLMIENSTSTVAVSASDADGDTVTLSISGGSAGTVQASISGSTVTLTPATDFTTATDITFTVTATDGKGGTSSKTIKVTDVIAGNRITASSGSLAVLTGGSATVVDPGLTVTGSATISAARVSITGNFTRGDVLSFTTQLGVTGSYDSVHGILTLTGGTTSANYQTVLRTVTFNTTALGTLTRTVSFSLGSGLLYAPTGHLYQFVSTQKTWTDAKAAAAALTLNGLGGYLATFTSSGEDLFITRNVGQTVDSSIGASDDFAQINAATGLTTYADQGASEGNWYWVTGPEAGTKFSTGSTAFESKYANWNSG